MKNTDTHTRFIKETAASLGFDYCGIAKAVRLDEDARRLEQWLNQGMHGSMKYMENHFELRVDPGKLVPGARSVITLLQNYYPSEQQDTGSPRIAKYAFGNDYHEIIRAKMNDFLARIREKIGDVDGRGFVDSAPVLERAWARKSGLGWIGKNGNLLTPKNGSFFFIATLITNLELSYDDPFARDHCGSCTRCIDACPTDAILPGKVVDGSKCISYFTIELKDSLIPDEMKGKFDDWAFGCDTCQDVCPWNRFSKPHKEAGLHPIPEILNLATTEWEHMTEESFRKIFRHSALSRTKWKGIQRNLKFLKEE
ncbi:tRNA epoxyqueuosine(34) reductase QueG [Terrimonas sp. NA20]|uniref:Epoxyqueuosine reductase n=1 Tax=Terrimonas ginsenosidimutans TaxID=2908004 RepID=A0ABS9KZC1_9BACT|nr:tRNA epoxyqueuosine(34) reductase QueG [Terrimonas ginsenosidimutans]MCG2617655.1 tRNA epoxyqueuosine(34) reductase QueG [Terrimonas ginsenosidimutans]